MRTIPRCAHQNIVLRDAPIAIASASVTHLLFGFGSRGPVHLVARCSRRSLAVVCVSQTRQTTAGSRMRWRWSACLAVSGSRL